VRRVLLSLFTDAVVVRAAIAASAICLAAKSTRAGVTATQTRLERTRRLGTVNYLTF
jgi:hypothetical protein